MMRKAAVFFILIVFLPVITFARADNSELIRQEVNRLGQKLDSCTDEYKAEQAKFSELSSANSMSRSRNDRKLLDCYGEIAYEAFHLFYPEKEEEMKKSFDSYVSAQSQLSENIYKLNGQCYTGYERADRWLSCGLQSNELSLQLTLEQTYTNLISLLEYTQNLLD